MDKKNFYIIDGHSIFYSSFFAIPSLITSKGLEVNAIYGFLKSIIKLFKTKNIDLISICFDAKGKNFRHIIYPEYKIQREKMPNEMINQKPILDSILQKLDIPILEIEGVEADDIIASLIKKYKHKNFNFYIISKDKDLMQLVDDNVFVFDISKDIVYNKQEVEKKFGIPPNKIIDLLSLIGDKSDNIPGIQGIGPKTAINLIKEFGDIDKILQNNEKLKENIKNKLIQSEEVLRLSYKLVSPKFDVDINKEISDFYFDINKFKNIANDIQEFEFNTIKKDINEILNIKIIDKKSKNIKQNKKYITIKNEKELQNIINEIKKTKIVAIDTETDSLDTKKSTIVGISLSINSNEGYYIPINHINYTKNIKDALKYIQEILDDKTILKIGQNLKYDIAILENQKNINIKKSQQLKLI